MKLHHSNNINFAPIDPLGGGLREEILAMQQNPEAIDLNEVPSESALANYLDMMVADSDDGSDLTPVGEED